MWGVGNNFKDTEPFEHLQLKFVKEILGIHCKYSNAACLAELNRKPPKTKIQLAAIQFLVTLKIVLFIKFSKMLKNTVFGLKL